MNKAEKLEAFNEGYLQELDARVARSELIGTVTLRNRSVALFFDRNTSKFTLLEKSGEEEAVSVFDTAQREQWGRQVMVFGHETNTGGYVASGHGTLTGDQFSIRLANGRYYRLTVDPTLPHLAPYFVEYVEKPKPERPPKPERAPKAKRPNNRDNGERQRSTQGEGSRGQPSNDSDAHQDDNEDFTEEDLARLRGEMPMASKKKRKG